MTEPPVVDETHLRAIAAEFDARYYLASNPDVAAAGLDPATHFLLQGWREGRNPRIGFDVVYYLRSYPDVAAANLNPLLHYVWAGRAEGRSCRRPMDTERRILEVAQPPSRRAGDWSAAAVTDAALPVASLMRALRAAVVGRTGFIAAVSHDDYERNQGGVQNLVREERLAFEAMGWAHLHLSPAAPLPLLAEPGAPDEFRVALRLGSDRLGVATIGTLCEALAAIRPGGGGAAETQLILVVHHLLGHAPEALLPLADLGTAPVIAWVHDYFTGCPSYTLMRNDVRFCGAPPLGSPACGVCVYGADRAAQHPRIRAFFAATRPIVLAPSTAALDLWRKRFDLAHRAADVQPLARLLLAPEPVLSTEAPAGVQPLRIAHLGYRTFHKGWATFEALATRFVNDSRYAFYQLGGAHGGAIPGNVRHVPVAVTRDAPDAMVEAIAEHDIDVALIWSGWPETFCYTAHEALAGGAFLLTRSGSGHVAALAEQHASAQGHVLEDEQALHDLLADGSLRDLLARSWRRRGALVPAGGTAGWMLQSDSGRRAMRGNDPVRLALTAGTETAALEAAVDG